MHLCLNFNADSETVKGNSTKIVCSIDPSRFTTFITILKDGTSKTLCDNANLCSPQNSDSGRYQYSSNSSSVAVTISNLTHSYDGGSWECKLGNTDNTMYELVVKSKFKYFTFLQIFAFSLFSHTTKRLAIKHLIQNQNRILFMFCMFHSEIKHKFKKTKTFFSYSLWHNGVSIAYFSINYIQAHYLKNL